MFAAIAKKFIGSANDRLIKRLEKFLKILLYFFILYHYFFFRY